MPIRVEAACPVLIANKMNKKDAIEYFNAEAERIQKKLSMDSKTLEAMDSIEDIVANKE